MVKLGGQGKEKIIRKTRKKNCWVGIWQRCYMGRTTRDLTKNIGDDWKGIGKNGRKKEN